MTTGGRTSRRGCWISAAVFFLAMAAFGAALAGLVVYLPMASGRWDLLPSMIGSLRHGWSSRLDPTPLPVSRAAAVDLRPHPALHLSARAGALDRNRRFEVRRLDRARLDRLAAATGNAVYAPVAAFDVDSGMQEGERFPGSLRLAFRPAELGIPEELWPYLQIAHVDPAGGLHPLRTRREGREVVSEVRHNSPFALTLVAIVGLKVLYLVDQVSKGALSDWHEDTVGGFRFYWPRTLPPRDTPEHRALDARLKKKWEEYRTRDVLADGDTPIWAARLRLYLSDPEVKAAYQLFHDPEWKKKHYYPPQVVHMVEAFQHAGEYLFETRGFRRRADLIEVYGLSPWTYDKKDAYAYTKDGHFTYPYVHVNLDLVPSSFPAHGGGEQGRADDLNTTAVHELFHVVQKEYFNWTKYANVSQAWGGGMFAWFGEATAVVLEEEAKAHYLGKRWNASRFPLTYDEGKFLGLMKLPLDAQGESEEQTTHKGYAASRFLLALRDRYYVANRDAFLPGLLEAFASFRSGPVDALAKVTSGSETTLGADYLLFVARSAWPIYDNVPPPQEANLGRARPLVRWPYTGPLAAPGFAVKWRGLDAGDLKSGKLLVRVHRSIDDAVYNRLGWNRSRATQFQVLTKPYAVHALAKAPVANPQAAAMAIQRVEAYARPPGWLTSAARVMSGPRRETAALLLLPPKAPPKLKIDEKRQVLHISIPPSVLWREGEIKEYRVKFHGPAGTKPVVVGLGDATEADINWAQIAEAQEEGTINVLSPLSAVIEQIEVQDLEDMMAIAEWFTLYTGQGVGQKISYYEVAKGDLDDPKDAGVEGPESEVFQVPIEGMALGGIGALMAGEWTGRILLVHTPASLSWEGGRGRVEWGGQSFRFDSNWDQAEKAFKLKLYAREGEREVPTGMTLYLRQLTRDRLWLGAPPIVFHRPNAPEKKGGFFDWFFGARQ